MLDIGIGEPLEVVELDLLLHRDAALAQPRQQRLRPRLQPDHEIRLAQLGGDRRVHLRVEAVLLVAQRQLGEDRVLGEHEVADHALPNMLDCARPRTWRSRWNRKNSWVWKA
jgi:hypothetical protein